MKPPPMKDNLPLTATITTITTNAHKVAPTTFLNLPPEILSKIVSHISVSSSSPCNNLLPYLVIHSTLTPYILQRIWRTIRVYDVEKFKASAVETGALQRNGRFIRSIESTTVEMLPHFGVETCPALEEIGIYWEGAGQVEDCFLALATFFRQHQGQRQEQEQEQEQARKQSRSDRSLLRKLQFSDGVLRGLSGDNEEVGMRHFQDVLRLIPDSVEELELEWMGFIRSFEYWHDQLQKQFTTTAISTFRTQDLVRRREGLTADQDLSSAPRPTIAQQDQPDDDASPILWLPGIKKLVFTENLGNVTPLIQACPNLESLSFFGCTLDSSIHDVTHLLRTHCPKLTSLDMSRSSGNRFGFPNPTDLPVFLYASVSGWKTLAFAYSDRFSITSTFQSGLLHHAGSIETLVLEGAIWKNSDIHAFLCEAPRLRRFLAIDGPVLTPQDVLVGDWACNELEIFRMAIDMIPRPDLPPLPPISPPSPPVAQPLPQFLPQPLTVPQLPFQPQPQPQPLPQLQPQPMHDPNTVPAPTPEDVVEVVTPEESHRLQRQVYRQLGRLTKLQELVLGEFEEDELVDTINMEYDQGYDRQAVLRRRRCLEMTLESGMDLLGELNLLRRVGLNGLEVSGFLAKEEDRRWVKERWPLLEEGYRNDFWKVYKRWRW
ncbi:MAG: hypothetical protein J3R72DRAFT_432948 [Linnemannia gamsii]|nr:MAG: hypothetical protein J3R72DRAFT_432948 [Linnemannia gamsii]